MPINIYILDFGVVVETSQKVTLYSYTDVETIKNVLKKYSAKSEINFRLLSFVLDFQKKIFDVKEAMEYRGHVSDYINLVCSIKPNYIGADINIEMLYDICSKIKESQLKQFIR